ncbi:MAG: ribosome silencing factor [Pseudomonadota bacterium]
MAELKSPTPQDVAQCVVGALDDGKAVDINCLDVRHLTDITDYMVIASGRSSRQCKALCDRVRDAMRTIGQKPLGVEGDRECEWVLIDCGDAIVHIMQPEVREFYQLEKLWSGTSDEARDAQ